MEFCKILDLELKKRRISRKQFSEMVHTTEATVCRWIKGNANPENHTFTKIADALGVSLSYLRGESSNELIPLLSLEQAGTWSENDTFSEYIEAPGKVPQKCFAVRIIGDSMTSASGLSIPDGFFCLVDPCCDKDPHKLNKHVVIAHHMESTTIKQLVFDAGKTYLKPWNTRYEMITPTPQTRIIGVILKCWYDLQNL